MPQNKEQLIEYTVLRKQDYGGPDGVVEVGGTVLLSPTVGERESRADNVIESALVKKATARATGKNKNTEVKADGA